MNRLSRNFQYLKGMTMHFDKARDALLPIFPPHSIGLYWV